MATWYLKGGSEYASSSYYMWFYMDHNGFDEGDYDTRDIESHGETDDAFMAFGVNTSTWSYGLQRAEIGLLAGNRIIFTTTEVALQSGYDPTGKSDSSLATKKYVDDAGGGAHTHDGETLQLDGINSDGGAFSFTTTGTVTFAQDIAMGGNDITGIQSVSSSNADLPYISLDSNGGGADTWLNQGAYVACGESSSGRASMTYVGNGYAYFGCGTITNGIQVSYIRIHYTNERIVTNCNLKISGTDKVDGALYAGSTNPTNTTRLNYDGYFYATRVYNAVYNDYADYWKAEVGVPKKPGYCYSLNKTGLRITDKRADKACMGICSDTYGHAVGSKQRAIPISVGGFILAHVDKEYDTGDLLVPNAKGILTLATKNEIIMQKCVAKYMYKETKIKTRGVNVNDRHWVKVV